MAESYQAEWTVDTDTTVYSGSLQDAFTAEAAADTVYPTLLEDVERNVVITANNTACLLHRVLTGEANSGWIIHDVDEDGEIDPLDAVKILCRVLNSSYSLKVNKTKRYGSIKPTKEFDRCKNGKSR